MAKRRTRKDKEEARHQFTLKWSGSVPVKRQMESKHEIRNPKFEITKNAKLSAKDSEIEPIKRDIVKSLILASLILCVELVLYLAWSK